MELIIKVEYQTAFYRGEIYVAFTKEVSDDTAIAKAKEILIQKAGGAFPLGYEHWRVVRRDYHP